MSLHLYCLRPADAPPPPPGLEGVDGAAVRLVETGEVGAWVSAPPCGAVDALRAAAHHRVIAEALRSGTPVPSRYGVGFPDEKALVHEISARSAELREALKRIDGRIEVGVSVLWDDEAGARQPFPAGRPPASGRAFLEERRERLAGDRDRGERAERLLREVEAALGWAYPVVRELLPRAGVAGSLAYLVPVEDSPLVLDTVRQLRLAPPAEVRGVGPWPPYSFV
jgi:hypothetical protein